MKKEYSDLMDSVFLSDDFKKNLIRTVEQRSEGDMKKGEKIEVRETSTIGKVLAVIAAVVVLGVGIFVGMKYLNNPNGPATSPTNEVNIPVESTETKSEPIDIVETKEVEKEPEKETPTEAKPPVEEPIVIGKKIPIDMMPTEYPINAYLNNVEEFFGKSPSQGMDISFKTLPVYFLNQDASYKDLKEVALKIVNKLGWTATEVSDEENYKITMIVQQKTKEGDVIVQPFSVSIIPNDKSPDVLRYLKKLDFKNPKKGPDRFIPYEIPEGTETYYETSDDPVEAVYFFSSKMAEVQPFDDAGRTEIMLHSDIEGISEKVGDYPVITPEEAKKLLLEGKNISSHVMKPTEESILGVELTYMIGIKGYNSPFYRFAVKTEKAEKLVINEYFVPALKSEAYDESLTGRQEVPKDLLPETFKPIKSMVVRDVASKKEVVLKDSIRDDFLYLWRAQGVYAYSNTKKDTPASSADPKDGYEIIITYTDGEEVTMTYPLYSIKKDGKRSSYYEISNSDPFTTMIKEELAK